jgi:MarR family 2-MHQ and catechol resistance regulon transcriptional repressor
MSNGKEDARVGNELGAQTDTGGPNGALLDPMDDESMQKLIATAGLFITPSTLLIVEASILFQMTYNALVGKNNDWFARYGLSIAKLNLLLLLRHAPDYHMSMSELSRDMIVTGANITQITDSLESAGIVRRARLPGDRRVVLAELTPKGLELADRIAPEHRRLLSELWQDMTEDDVRLLNHLMMKLKRSVSRVPKV